MQCRERERLGCNFLLIGKSWGRMDDGMSVELMGRHPNPQEPKGEHGTRKGRARAKKWSTSSMIQNAARKEEKISQTKLLIVKIKASKLCKLMQG